jgi:hypothetical protein
MKYRHWRKGESEKTFLTSGKVSQVKREGEAFQADDLALAEVLRQNTLNTF